MALEALFDELRRDLEDEELAKIVLETLDIITSKSGYDHLNGNDPKNSNETPTIQTNSQFCEILLKVNIAISPSIRTNILCMFAL